VAQIGGRGRGCQEQEDEQDSKWSLGYWVAELLGCRVDGLPVSLVATIGPVAACGHLRQLSNLATRHPSNHRHFSRLKFNGAVSLPCVHKPTNSVPSLFNFLFALEIAAGDVPRGADLHDCRQSRRGEQSRPRQLSSAEIALPAHDVKNAEPENLLAEPEHDRGPQSGQQRTPDVGELGRKESGQTEEDRTG